MILLFVYFSIAMVTSALCSVMEAVLLSTPQSFLAVASGNGKKWPAIFLSLKQNIDKPLSAILSLNTVAHTVGAAGVGAQAIKVFGEASFGIVSAILTVLILVFTEIIPKTAGARYWRSLAGFSSYVIKGMIYVTYPLVIVSAFITNLMTRNRNEQVTSREEISALTSIGAQEGIFNEDELRIIQNLLQLKDLRVAKVMTPRIVVAIADENMTLEQFVEFEEFYQFSRIPVYAANEDDITGYVLRQEVLEQLIENHKGLQLKDVKREILIFPFSTTLYDAWSFFMKERDHIALVVDEYGGMAGILTLEDIIETLLGLEIVDEKDTTADLQEFARQKWQKKMSGTNYWQTKGRGV